MLNYQRFICVYRSREGTPVCVRGVRYDALKMIRRAQADLGSTDFQYTVDNSAWLDFSNQFNVPTHPTWDECLAFLKTNRAKGI